MSVSEIISSLGGSSAVARYTGWPVQTVDSWVTKGQIPEWRKPKLLEMALEVGASIAATDFPPKKPRAKPGEAIAA